LLAADQSLCGFNVTIPHKVGVLPFLNEMDEAARQIGAVNCISIQRMEGIQTLKGYNTDAFGFEQSLLPLLDAGHRRALIFGDGGAAKAVKYVLDKLDIPFLVVSRRPSKQTISYADVTPQLLQEHTVLI